MGAETVFYDNDEDDDWEGLACKLVPRCGGTKTLGTSSVGEKGEARGEGKVGGAHHGDGGDEGAARGFSDSVGDRSNLRVTRRPGGRDAWETVPVECLMARKVVTSFLSPPTCLLFPSSSLSGQSNFPS